MLDYIRMMTYIDLIKFNSMMKAMREHQKEIEEMIEKRQAARKDRNFALADQIRDELLAKGIILEDTREGVKWKKA